MAKQTIDLGTAPLATDGDTPRAAFDKVNDNADEIYGIIGAVVDPADSLATAQASVNSEASGSKGIAFEAGTHGMSGTLDIGKTSSYDRRGYTFTGASIEATIVSGTVLSTIPDIGGNSTFEGHTIENMTIDSGGSVIVNDRTADVTSADMNFVIRHKMDKVLVSSSGTTGIGVDLSKSFNTSLSDFQVSGFSNSLSLQACDIGLIENGRLFNFYDTGIHEVSVSTLGSQNLIQAMDILPSAVCADTSVAYRTSSRHVQFNFNYVEYQKTFECVTDVGPYNQTAYGSNTPGNVQSTIMLGNRFEGMNNAAEAVHRVQATASSNHTILVYDVNESGNFAAKPSGFTSDGSATLLEHIPAHAYARPRTVDITGRTWGRFWNGTKTRPAFTPTSHGGFLVNGENIDAHQYNGIGTPDAGFMNRRGQFLRIAAGDVSKAQGIIPGGLELTPADTQNSFFATGKTYDVIVWAMTSNSGGDTIQVQLAGDDAGGVAFGTSYQSANITNQLLPYRFRFSGYAQNYDFVGLNVRSSTAVGNIDYMVEIVPVSEVKESYTPVLTAATPGDLSVGYTTQQAWQLPMDNGMVMEWGRIQTSSFTHTTASGSLKITGGAYTPENVSSQFFNGSAQFSGLSKANYTNYTSRRSPNDSALYFVASGPSSANLTGVNITDFPTGGSVVIEWFHQFLRTV